MKTLTIVLIILLAALQYKLWIEEGGALSVWHLQKAVDKKNQENSQLKQRNKVLEVQIKDLKMGHDAVEEIARTELGMVKKGEDYYQIVTPGK